MSRRGNPYDNALAENFFSMYETDLIHIQQLYILHIKDREARLVLLHLQK